MLTDTLRSALLVQTACGNKELKAFLEKEIDICEMCLNDGHCTQQLQYLSVHLCLIEAAQVFARNKIDQQQRQLTHNTQERYTAFAERHTDGESTSTGRSCSWSTTTSQQNFVRDSTDDTVAWAEHNLLRTAETLEDGYDRSNRTTVGNGFTFSHVIHTLDDKEGERLAPGEGLEISRSNRASGTSGGTGPLLPVVGTHWFFPFELSTTPPFLFPPDPGPLIDITPAGTGDEVCPPFDPLHPDRDRCFEPGLAHPSAGQGFHGKFRASISLAVPGTGTLNFSLEYDRGFNERQYYHCSSSFVTGTSTTTGRDAGLSTARTIARPSENRTSSRETTYIAHLVRKNGSSTRRGTTTTDAEDVQVGRSAGESHSQSQRDLKAQAYQQRRAETLTTQHGEAHLRRTETLRDDEERRAFGQISLQLAELWKRVWARQLLLERQFAAAPKGGAMNCPVPANCCAPLKIGRQWH